MARSPCASADRLSRVVKHFAPLVKVDLLIQTRKAKKPHWNEKLASVRTGFETTPSQQRDE
jgi:hypothetical protein